MLKFVAGYVWHIHQLNIHKIKVLINIIKIIKKIQPNHKWKLFWMGLCHDFSKYGWLEASFFAKTIFDLKHSVYSTEGYRDLLARIQPAISSHYKKMLIILNFIKMVFKI